MSDLGWRADGIERAIAAGAVELEVYRRPGFTGGKAVRRTPTPGTYAGFEIHGDPEPYTDEDHRRQ